MPLDKITPEQINGNNKPIEDVADPSNLQDAATKNYVDTQLAGQTGTWGSITGTLSNQTDLQTALDGKADLSGGKVPESQLPDITITDTFVVASEVAMLALSAQTGDVAVRTDESKSYILKGTDPSILAQWQELLTPGDAVTSVDGRTGVVTLGDLYATAAQGALADTALQDITGENIGDLADVTNATPADKHVLIYDGVTDNKYENRALTKADISDFSDGDYAAASHTHSTADITSGTFADARIAETNVTQHQAALSITESQISDLQSYLLNITGEAIGSLSDVVITTVADNELLAYDSTSGNWINQTPTAAGVAEAAHTHVKGEITDFNEADYATGAEGDLATTATQPGDNISTLTNDSGFITGVAWGSITGTLSNQLDLTTALSAKADTVHTHVKADITDADWITGVAWGDITGTLSSQTDLQTALDAKADVEDIIVENGFTAASESTLSFVDGTRTFSIYPSATNFTYWAGGDKYTVSSTHNVVITDVEGIHAIYYDGATLTAEHAPTEADFDNLIIPVYAFVCAIYWDATNKTALLVMDERHGRTMDSRTHQYLHRTQGTAYEQGLALADMVVDGNGSLNTHAQLGYAAGVIWDEDIKLEIDALAGGNNIPLFYREGTTNWRATDTAYTVLTTGTGRAAYNSESGGSYAQTEVSNNSFVLTHYFATGDISNPMIAVQGQAEYGNASAARAGALTEITDLAYGQLSALTPEFKAIATVINKTSNTMSNAVKSAVVSTDSGADYVDWREDATLSSGGATATNHNDLAGLQGGAAGDYQHLTTAQVGLVDAAVQPADNISTLTNDSGYLTTVTASTIDAEASTDGYVLTSDGAGNVAWEAQTGGITNIVDDTTPELGGDLNLNGKDFTNNQIGSLTIYDSVVIIDDSNSGGNNSGLAIRPPSTGGVYADLQLLNTAAATQVHLRYQESDDTAYLYNFTANPMFITGLGTLPSADGTNGQLLSTNGAGVLSWSSAGSGTMTDVIDDTTPQLGGGLDTNGQTISDAVSQRIRFNNPIHIESTNASYNSDIYFRPQSGGSGQAKVVFYSSTGSYKGKFEYKEGTDKWTLQARGANAFDIKADAGLYLQTTAGDIELLPSSGDVIINNIAMPAYDGNVGECIITDGSGNLSFGNFFQGDYNSNIKVTPVSLTGTVSTTASDATITGSGTSFLTDLAVGDSVQIGTDAIPGSRQLVVTVDSITSDTSFECTSNNVPPSTLSGQAIEKWPAQTVSFPEGAFWLVPFGGSTWHNSIALQTGDVLYAYKSGATHYDDFFILSPWASNIRPYIPTPSAATGSSGDVGGNISFDNDYFYICTADYDGSTNIWKSWPLQDFETSTAPVAAPSTSTGASGDKQGDVAYDSNYIYYCTADYDGSTAIWKRAALSTW